MAPASYTPYNPAAHGPPSALLPEEVFGHVDVATLGDITQYLRESESQDDIELATWIQRNYLHGLRKDQSTATIRTPEGFAQLDRAYRRVRSLTNKAQDKWPFFDKNFKQMSTSTVRNNARGEASPGVLFNKDGMRRSSGLGEQSQATFNHNASPGPQLQAPFGDRNLGRFRERKQQELPRQARQIPDPLPPKLPANVEKRPESEKRSVPPDQQDLTRSQRQTSSVQEFPRYTDFFSESDGQAMPMAMLEAPRSNSSLSMLSRSAETELSQASPGAVTRPVDSGVSRKSNSEIGEDPNLELVRDTGGGKVRGEDGRYLPKDKPVLSPRSKKNGKKRRERERMAMVKEAEKRKSATRSTVSEEQDQQQDSEHEPEQEQEQEQEQEPQPESPAPGQDEDVFADVQTPSPSAQNDTIEVHTEPDLPSEGIHGHLSGLSQDTTPEPTLAYLLAAEADAVPSNLDRLPPNSRKVSKRKSKPTSQAEGALKKRKVGRPRKSEQLGGSVNEQSPQSNMAEAEELPPMTTRRTTRRSAAASVQETPKSAPEVQPEPEKPAVVQAEDDKIVGDTAVEIEANLHTRTSSAHGREDAVMSGVEKDATAGREEQKGQEEVHAPVPTDSASKLGAPSATDSRPSSVTPAATTPRSTKKTAPQISDHDLLNIGLRKTSSPTTQRVAPYVSPYQQVPPQNFTANINSQNAKSNSNMSKVTSIQPTAQATQPAPTTPNGAVPTGHAPGHVEFFARITTGSGMMEVPIAPSQLDRNEEKMIRKYAEWNVQSNAVPVPYAQFRQIFAFAIQHE